MRQWHLRAEPEALAEFVHSLAALANHYERAMVTFLDHASFWNGATLFYHADTLQVDRFLSRQSGRSTESEVG